MSRFGIFAGICFAIPALFAQTNLVTNPGFEEGVKGWGNWAAKSEISIITDDVKSGEKALRYVHDVPNQQGVIVSRFTAKPETGYTFSCWLKGKANVLEAKIFYWGADGKYLGESAPFSGCELKDWFLVKKTFTTKKGTESVSVGVLVKNGYVIADDFCVTEGYENIQADNELFNTSFRYSCRTDGMPDYWSGFGFDPFSPEHEQGKFFRKAKDVESPVPGTDVLYYNGVSASPLFTSAVSGNQWYTFSMYIKSDKDNAKFTLKCCETKQEFTVGKDWKRIELTVFKKNAGNHGTWFYFEKDTAFYVAAPMLEAGKKATKWRPSPMDAMLPNLWAGKQSAVQAGPPRAACPKAQSWAQAASVDSFCNIKDGKFVKGKFKGYFYLDGKNTLHAAVESQTGKKAVAPNNASVQHPDNDIAELFISPNEDGAPYWHFMIGRNGAVLAQKGAGGIGIKGTWEHSAKEIPGGWRAEFEIPLSDVIDLPGQKVWRMSLCATESIKAKQENYSCSGKNGFHTPGGFMFVTGLPFSGRAVESEARITTDYDAYMKETAVNVLAEDMKFPAELKVSDEKGKVYYTAKMTEKNALIPLKSLPDGYYVIEVAGNGKKASSYFRKLAYKKNATRLNRFKQIIEVDGKPFFPTVFSWKGKYNNVPTEWQFKELKKHNFNTIMIMPEMYVWWNSRNKDPERRRGVIKAAAKEGFKIIIWADGPREFCGMKSLVDVRKKQMDEVADINDAIIGWYFVDEIAPAWEKQFNLTESDFTKGYRELKDYNPYTLQFINWNWTGLNSSQKFYGSYRSTDLYSFDCYPYCGSINFGALDTHEKAASIIGTRQQLDFLPSIVWLHTYSYCEGLREPHQTEYQNNVFISLIWNQSGFMNFIGHPESMDLWHGMGKSYGTALKWLNMTADPGSKLIKRGKIDGISYALWKNGQGGYAFVAANTHYAKGEIEIESGIKGGENELIGGEGKLTVKDGKMKVQLPIAGSAVWFIK